MAGAQYEKLECIFAAALQRRAGAERAAYLDAACAGNADLRARVDALLEAHDQAGDFLETPAVDPGAPATNPPPMEKPGTWIGRYRLVQVIGEGGFGCVYMAEQQEPVRRKVALKIIKPGMDTRQVIARFEAERQALALMDHPNIAMVFDAGATETGRPYFVMELVKGIPIVEFCDKGRLTTSERLTLFIQVCQAVQHAHQKGVIHRDIKPSNVLVTLHDSAPVPKVIDFGIAKATSRPLTDKTLFTELRQFVGTPEYMSPDQTEISGLDVDTRTDIYSLGALLYTLLTGTTPFDSRTLRGAAYDEIKRIIREVEPPKPSTRVSTLAQSDAGSAIAHHRRSEPAALSRVMRGDLDWIVMKAMEKDRTRRYQTAQELAADIERHLKEEPVLAGPPSVTYRFSKFLRRHRFAVGAATAVAAAIIFGLVLSTTFYFQAARQRDAARAAKMRADQEAVRSRRIADFLQDLLVSVSPDQVTGRAIDVARAVAIAQEVFGDDHATVAAALSSRALQLQSAGELEAAEQMYAESLRIWRERYGDANLNVAATLRLLGVLQMTKGDHEAAERALRESVRITRTLPGEKTVTLANTLALLGTVLANRGRYAEARAFLQESVDTLKAVAPTQRLQIAVTTSALGNVLIMSGQEDAVRKVLPEVIDSWRKALPPNSGHLAMTLTQVSYFYLEHNEFDTAEPLLREALSILEASPRTTVPTQRQAMGGLRRIFEHRGTPAAIIPFATRALEGACRGEDKEAVQELERTLGDFCWTVAGKPKLDPEAYRTSLQAFETYLSQQSEVPPGVLTKGALYFRSGRYEDALTALKLADESNSAKYEQGHPPTVALLAMTEHRLGHREQANAAMGRLRRAMQDAKFAGDEECRAFLAEAEALIGNAAGARR